MTTLACTADLYAQLVPVILAALGLLTVALASIVSLHVVNEIRDIRSWRARRHDDN